jgi:hypothetical protein
MNEDYPVRFALLKVGRRDKKPNVESGNEEQSCQHRERWDQFACERVEIRRRCVFVPVYLS